MSELRADDPTVRLGAGDFTIWARLHTPANLTQPLGDILSQYDPEQRRGIHLGVMDFAGVAASQSNFRHLTFGIDDGSDHLTWTDCGRPGNNVWVSALAVHDGCLYAGTYEEGADECGHVYRYDGGTDWTDCGSPDGSNAVMSLAVFDNQLYAGTGHYRAQGSSLQMSPNQRSGGKVMRYAGGSEWVDCGKLNAEGRADPSANGEWVRRLQGWSADDIDTAGSLTVFDGQLYAVPNYHRGVYRFDGDSGWEWAGDPGCRLMALGVFDGRMYAAGNEGHQRGGIYRYEGGAEWSFAGGQAGVDQVYSFAQYGGAFLAGTWPDARVFRFDGEQNWDDCGKLGNEQEVMGMAVYNGQLYAGTLPLAEVYRYDGNSDWTSVGCIDDTPVVKYRRAWSMAVFGGRLYCGTLPSGHVHALEVGQCVTVDRELPAGEHTVAAVRRGGQLELTIDGVSCAVSSGSHKLASDVTADCPVTIGDGVQGRFGGSIHEVRLFDAALSAEEIGRLEG